MLNYPEYSLFYVYRKVYRERISQIDYLFVVSIIFYIFAFSYIYTEKQNEYYIALQSWIHSALFYQERILNIYSFWSRATLQTFNGKILVVKRVYQLTLNHCRELCVYQVALNHRCSKYTSLYKHTSIFVFALHTYEWGDTVVFTVNCWLYTCKIERETLCRLIHSTCSNIYY